MTRPSNAIVPLDTARCADLRRFAAVPLLLHRHDPDWVAPLFSELAAVLGPANPFWEHADAAVWVATGGARDVGRIAAIHDRSYNRLHGGNTAFFGFFESTDDPDIAARLFDTAASWARDRDLDRLLGPMNPSINDECGLLVDGFGSPPTVMTPHNPPYYPRLLESAGFEKAKDLLAYEIDPAHCPETRLDRLRRALERRHPEITVRPVTRRSLDDDVPKIRDLYNHAWEQNWGAVPFTGREIECLVGRLKPLLVDGLVWVAQTGDTIVGLLLLLPDANEIIKPLRGRLLSPGLPKALPYLLGLRHPRRTRLVVLGTAKNYRGQGIEAAMLSHALQTVKRLGMTACEASWMLEDNLPVLRMVEAFGGRHTKTFRLYGRTTAAPSTRR